MDTYPFELNLNNGPPFSYSNVAISAISNTEVFRTGIDKRDGNFYILCGFSIKEVLEHCYIVPKGDEERVCTSFLYFNYSVNYHTVGVYAS